MSATNTTYNSDLSTYDLFKQLEQQFHSYVSSTQWRNELDRPKFEVDSTFVEKIIYPKMKQEADMLAEKLAKNIPQRTERWQSATSMTLAHHIIEVLFSKGIRRGSIPSEMELLRKRETIIRNGLSNDDGLKFAILMLPSRDRNKAKNDGFLPDLGEIISLLQLWLIVKAMLLVTEECAQLLIKLFQKVDPSVKTIADIVNSIDIPISNVTNTKRAALKKELMESGYSIDWFIKSLTEVNQVQTKSIRIFVVQDARRYTTYDTDLDEHIQAYAKSLTEISECLGLDKNIILTSHAQLEIQHPQQEELQIFLKRRTEVYTSKLEQYSQPFLDRKVDLMMCKTRENFLTLVDEISLNKNISQLIEPILHGRYHPELADAHLSSTDELTILAQIYEPQLENTGRELLRQALLFSSLINATRYLCSYEAQTSSQNIYRLDDIQFLLPGAIRLSIHNKSLNCDQFLIKCGPNVHRQPWHGTAGLRLRKNKDPHSLSFEIRLSLEYKVENYVPVFIKKDLMIEPTDDHHRYLSTLASMDQPILWIHPDLVQMYAKNDDGLQQIFGETSKIRLI